VLIEALSLSEYRQAVIDAGWRRANCSLAIPDPVTADFLEEGGRALSDPSVMFRLKLIFDLRHSCVPRVQNLIIRALKYDTHAIVRRKAAAALAYCELEAPEEALVEALSDPSDMVRTAVLTAIHAKRIMRAVPAVCKLLKDESETVRWVACCCLTILGVGDQRIVDTMKAVDRETWDSKYQKLAGSMIYRSSGRGSVSAMKAGKIGTWFNAILAEAEQLAYEKEMYTPEIMKRKGILEDPFS